jgi:hypothetical protein
MIDGVLYIVHTSSFVFKFRERFQKAEFMGFLNFLSLDLQLTNQRTEPPPAGSTSTSDGYERGKQDSKR